MDIPVKLSPAQVIQVEHMFKSYGKVKAVVDVSFIVKRGEIFGLLGPNGAGKTTTLSILEGLRKADSGHVSVLEMDIDKFNKSVKQRIGVQLQSTSLLPDLTVFEQVQLFGRLYGSRSGHSEIEALLAQVGLSEKMSNFPDKLSGGQQQRLSLALALVNRPEIIFLDEPTNGLDPQSRRVLWDIIRKLREQGRTVVLTTHYNVVNDRSINPLIPTLNFSATLLHANLRNLKELAITLGMPLFMLFTIWVPSLAGDQESQEIRIIILFSGQTICDGRPFETHWMVCPSLPSPCNTA